MKKEIVEILRNSKTTKEAFESISNRFKGVVPLTPELLKAIGEIEEKTINQIPEIPDFVQNLKISTLDITAQQLRDSVFTPLVVENFGTPSIFFVTALAFRTPISVGINQGSGQSTFDIICGNMNILDIGTSSINRWERGYHITNMNAAVSPYNSQSSLTVQASGDLLGTTGGGDVKLVIAYVALPV